MSAIRLTVLLFGAQLAERCEGASQPEPTILPDPTHGPRVAVDVLLRDPNLAIPSDPMAGDLCSAHCMCNGAVTQ